MGQKRHAVVRVDHARGTLRARWQRDISKMIGGAAYTQFRTQVSLVPPPCEELTTSEPSLQRHASGRQERW